MRKILLLVLAAITALVVILLATGNGYLFKGIWATYMRGVSSATVDDKKFFDQRLVPVGEPQPWPLAASYNKGELPPALLASLEQSETEAFLIFYQDSLLHESYYLGRTDTVRSNSFSMAKTVVTLLAQIAIQQGYLKGWDQPVKQLCPELTGAFADSVQLWHLSTMSSGQEWDESYKNPFGVTAKAYYGDRINELVLEQPIVEAPGKSFAYKSGTTQLLAICVERATGMTISDMASNFLWQAVGAERNATWHLDKPNGDELAYCCLNASARDFGRLGKLLLHNGKWGNFQLIDSSFVDLMQRPRFAPEYGYGVWIDYNPGEEVYYFRGILGQYIIIFPNQDLVVVRLGRKEIKQPGNPHARNFETIVEQVLNMHQNAAHAGAH